MTDPVSAELDQPVGLDGQPVSGRDAADILRAIARMSPLPMVLTDPHREDAPAVFCNAAFTRLTGYAEDEVVGRNLRFLQGPETDDRALEVLRKSITAQKECQVELWNYRRDGSKFWCSMFVGPVFDSDDRLLCWFGSQLDTGSRRELDQAHARTQRMDTLGAMAAGIAHEFNNLMTVVMANAEGVAAERLTPRQAERLERVNWAARSAGRLTEQMLSFAGRNTLRAETVELNTILRAFDQLLAQAARNGVRTELQLSPEPLTVMVDPGQLELALINLVRNASDASAPHGVVLVQTRAATLHGQAAAEIAVVDTGSGMAQDVAARATEPFYTTKPPGLGTGLGLSMVSGFAEQSGGTMSIETVPGQGTTIRLVFATI